MKILITGGLGFIGSALIRALLNDPNLDILNIDKCSYASMPEALEGRDSQDNYNFKKIIYRVFDTMGDTPSHGYMILHSFAK